MRIAIRSHLYPPLGIGGAERSVQYLAEALVQRGHEVLVITSGIKFRTRTEVINGVKVARLGAPPGFTPNIYDHRTPLQHLLRRILRRWRPNNPRLILEQVRMFRPDVVHTNTGAGMPRVWAASREFAYASVHTLRNPNLLCDRRMFAEGRSCGRQCAPCEHATAPLKKASSFPHAVVGISDFILQLHLTHDYFRGVPLRRVIPNSYDRRASASVARAPSPFIRLGFLGRLHPTKGIEELLAAMRHFPDAHLVIGGTGNPDYVKELKRTAGANAEFLGFVDGRAFFEQVDALVVPSVWDEPFGRVYAEAMCHGLPVVGSVFGAGSELVDHGRNGWLCDPTNDESLRAALRQCLDALSAPNAHLFRKAALQQAERFSPISVAQQYEEVYLAALEHSRGTARASVRIPTKTFAPPSPSEAPL